MDPFNIFVNFITQHWVLSVLFGVLLLAVILNECMQRFLSIPRVTPQEAIQLLNHKQALIVDMRTEAEFITGHIIHAVNIPPALVETKMHMLKKQSNLPVIIVCVVGQTALQVARQLKTHGFTELYILEGGLQAWKQANLPLVKK